MDDLIECLGIPWFISTLDLTKGYWQVTDEGLLASPHGAPATFQHLMDIVLRLHHQFVAAFLDNVVIHSST